MNKDQMAKLRALLDRRNREPARTKEIDLEIKKQFLTRRAVYMSDMSGFSKIVRQFGIIHFLAVIQRMRSISLPTLETNHGSLVKAEADNILVVFECVEDALRTAQTIRAEAARVNPSLPDEQQVHLSIGIGWGEVLLMEAHDIYGDEVNLASKLGEDIAERDELLLTDAAYQVLPRAYARCEEKNEEVSSVRLRYWKVLS